MVILITPIGVAQITNLSFMAAVMFWHGYWGGWIGGDMGVRPEVKKFANEMEENLSCNDHKTGWKNLNLVHLLYQVKAEIKEIELALINQELTQAGYECVDAANFLMMLADNVGYLKD